MSSIFKKLQFKRKQKPSSAMEDEITSLARQYGTTPEQIEAIKAELGKSEARVREGNGGMNTFDKIVRPIYENMYEANANKYSTHPGIVDLANKVQSGKKFLDLAQMRPKDYEARYDDKPVRLNKANLNGYHIYAPTMIRSTQGSHYSPATNLINIENNKLADLPHELGHMISQAYNMQGAASNANGVPYRFLFNMDEDLVDNISDYREGINRYATDPISLLKQNSDPWSLYKVNPNIFNFDRKFNRINEANYGVLNEEYRASELGTRVLDDSKLDAASRYAITFDGTPTYLAGTADNLHIFSPDEIRRMKNAATQKFLDGRFSSAFLPKDMDVAGFLGLKRLDTVDPKRMPAPRPVYNSQDQARAIADFRQHEHQRQQHPYVMKQWGYRPEEFENEGLWVPGMNPITDAERRMQDYAYGKSQLPFSYTGNGLFNTVYDNDFNVKYNPSANSLVDGRGNLLMDPKQREYNDLMSTRTWKGYDTIADRMGNLAHAYLSASSPEESKSNVLNLIDSRRPFYVTPETIKQDIRDSYYTAQGQSPDVRLPRPEIREHLNRITTADPINITKGKNMAKSYGMYIGTSDNELAADHFTKPVDYLYYYPHTPTHRPTTSSLPYRNPYAPKLPSMAGAGRTYSNYGAPSGMPSRTSYTSQGRIGTPQSNYRNQNYSKSSYNNSFNNSTSTLSAYRRK